MLPDYIIYDELQRERNERDESRPRVEIPQDPPPEFDEPEEERDEDGDEEETDRGVTIIEM